MSIPPTIQQSAGCGFLLLLGTLWYCTAWQRRLLAQTLGASLAGETLWNQAETTMLDELLAFTNTWSSPREINT